jgi:DNA-directed RNA polymerase alpha subunit
LPEKIVHLVETRLPTKVRLALYRNNIDTVGDLLDMNLRDLFRIANIGAKGRTIILEEIYRLCLYGQVRF